MQQWNKHGPSLFFSNSIRKVISWNVLFKEYITRGIWIDDANVAFQCQSLITIKPNTKEGELIKSDLEFEEQFVLSKLSNANEVIPRHLHKIINHYRHIQNSRQWVLILDLKKKHLANSSATEGSVEYLVSINNYHNRPLTTSVSYKYSYRSGVVTLEHTLWVYNLCWLMNKIPYNEVMLWGTESH